MPLQCKKLLVRSHCSGHTPKGGWVGESLSQRAGSFLQPTRFISKNRYSFMSQQLFACTNCGHIGYRLKKKKGSIFITIILILFFILPGILYMLWRGSTKHYVCSSCGGQTLVPITSPAGVKILESQGKTIASVQTEVR